MAIREPKSKTTTSITVTGRDGSCKGNFEISSGYLYYHRVNATKESGRWTLQQLIELLEAEIESNRRLDSPPNMPYFKKSRDLFLYVQDDDSQIIEGSIVDEIHSVKDFEDKRKLQEDIYQIDGPVRKKYEGFTWKLGIGVNTAIYIIDLYISKLPAKKTNKSVVKRKNILSRENLIAILQYWLSLLK